MLLNWICTNIQDTQDVSGKLRIQKNLYKIYKKKHLLKGSQGVTNFIRKDKRKRYPSIS